MRTAINWRHVGARIKRMRLARGLSQADLAAPHYTAAYISHLEKGRRTPSQEALEHLASRLGLTGEQLLTGRDPDTDLRLKIEIDGAVADLHQDRVSEAKQRLDAARDEAEELGLLDLVGSAEEALALVDYRQGRWDSALARVERAQGLLADAPVEDATPLVTLRARCLFAQGETNHAIHVLERHLVTLRDLDPADPAALLQTYSALIGPYFEAGIKERAAHAADEAHRLEKEVQDPEHVACLNINRAQILLDRGKRGAALKSLARAEDLFRQIGWRDSAAKAAVARAHAAVEVGDLKVGRAGALAALEGLGDSGHVIERARALSLLGRIARLDEDPDSALELLDKAIAALGDEPAPFERAWARREQGLCLVASGDLSKAERAFRDALALYEEAQAPNQVANTAALLGDVLAKRGQKAAAAKAYRLGLSAIEDLA